MKKCSSCNYEWNDDRTFCIRCGKKWTESQEDEKKMICRNCGAELKEEDLFCGKCGTKVGVSDPVCPSCGGKVTSDEAFCSHCGYQLKKTEQPDTNNTIEMLINLQTSKNWAGGAANSGKLLVDNRGVTYQPIIGISSKNVRHSYTFGEIQSTSFQMTRVGLQPLFGYSVTLKNGTVYNYTYSPLQKAKLTSIDQIIHSKM